MKDDKNSISSDTNFSSVKLNMQYRRMYKEMNAILDVVPVSVLLFDKDGYLIYFNKIAASVFCLDDNDLDYINVFQNRTIPSHFIDELKKTDVDKFKLSFTFRKEGDKVIRDYSSQCCDVYLETSTRLLYDENDNVTECIAFVFDVTEKVIAKRNSEERNLDIKLVLKSSDLNFFKIDPKSDSIFFLNKDLSLMPPLSLTEHLNKKHPDDIKDIVSSINSLEKGECSEKRICYRYINDGNPDHYTYVDALLVANREDGELENLSGVEIDVTKDYKYRKSLEELNSKMALAIKVSKLVQWEYDVLSEEMTVSYLKGEKIKERKISIDTLIRFLISKSSANDQILNTLNMMREGRNSTVSSPINISFGGKLLYFSSIGGPLKKNVLNYKVIKYAGFLIDNTELKEVNVKLDEARKNAESASVQKSSFLANMSHEIRSPLNVITGFANLLSTVDNDEERKQYCEIISKNSVLLQDIINGILDLSKIESGNISFNPSVFKLSETIKSIMFYFEVKVPSSIKINCSIPENEYPVFMDEHRISQVLNNFTSNAIKYTKEGSISIGYQYVKNGVKLFVSDTGAGISPENQQFVFDRFTRYDSSVKGNGLGLEICKTIVTKMNGQIGVDSELGKGSTFWAIIPCDIIKNESDRERVMQIADNSAVDQLSSQPQDTSPSNSQHLSKGKHELKILVAEDNDNNFFLMKIILKSFNIDRAVNGAEAVEKARNGKYDIIFMDIKMPVMDGLEATANIRKFDPDIKIVAVTAFAFDSDRQLALNSGCNDFLPKPISKSKLMEILDSL